MNELLCYDRTDHVATQYLKVVRSHFPIRQSLQPLDVARDLEFMLQCLDNPELPEDVDDLLSLHKWLQDNEIKSARYHDCVEADIGLYRFIEDLNRS